MRLQASALLFVEPRPLFTQQFLQGSVFLHQEVDDIVLLLRQPPGQRDDQHGKVTNCLGWNESLDQAETGC